MEPVQALWIGNGLSTMERLCINSFLKNGHPFHLYVYDDVEDIPDGTTICDANEILGKDKIFHYSDSACKSAKLNGTIAAFSNMFRYKLLYDKGGYWVDMDIICLKPFEYTEPYVFSSETRKYFWNKDQWQRIVDININAGVMKAPVKSDFALHCYLECERRSKADLTWGEIGPKLVKEGVDVYRLHKYVKDPDVFCPISYPDIKRVMMPFKIVIKERWMAIHLWNEYWKRIEIDKDKNYDKDCLYEYLKDIYL